MTEQSADIAELAKALAKVQAEVKASKKDSVNPFFKGPGKPEGSKYSDLAAVWEACREPLTKHGFSVVQLPVSEAGTKRVGVETMLLHASGQWKKGTVYATPEKETAQAIGSCITYLRRYSLAAVASVCPEDDDGNAASGKGVPANSNGNAPPKPKPPRADTVPHNGEFAEHKQIAYLHALVTKAGLACKGDCAKATKQWSKRANGLVEKMAYCTYHGQLRAFDDQQGNPVDTSTKLSKEQISNLIGRYEAKLARQEAKSADTPDLEAAFSQAEENARLRETIGPGADG